MELSTQRLYLNPRLWVRSPLRVSINGKRYVYKMSHGLSFGGMGNKEKPRKENNREKPVREEKK